MSSVNCLSIVFLISSLIGPALRYKSLYLFHLLLVCFFIVIFLKEKKLIDYLKTSKEQIIPIILYITFCVVSLSYSLEKSFGLKIIIIQVIGFSLSIAVSYIIKKQQIILPYLLKSCFGLWALQIILGFFDIFTNWRYPISRLSSLNHYFGIQHYEQHLLNSDIIMTRASGLNWGINDYSTFLTLSIPFIFFGLKNKFIKWTAILISLFFIIHNESKAAILTLFLYVALFLIYLIKNGLLKELWKKGLVLFTLIASLTFLLNYSPFYYKFIRFSDQFNKEWKNIDLKQTEENGQIASNRKRLRWIKGLIPYIKKKPLQGLGIGSSGSAKIHSWEKKTTSIHFFFLELFTDLGLIGFLLYLWTYLKSILLSIRSNHFLGKASFTCLLVFPFLSLGLSSAYYYLPLYFLLGIPYSLVGRNEVIEPI